MIIKRGDILKKLKEINRYPDLLAYSAVRADDILSEFLEKLEPKPEGIIEIGTWQGIATVVLASGGKIVYTYDIAYRDAEYIWNLFGVRNKIRCCIAPQWQIDEDIKIVAKESKINFDFAFIDGNHTDKDVRHDFELVKKCGRILFHNANFRQIHKFVVDELNAKIIDEGRGWYAYWEDK